jgi:hypothetical protein
MISNSCDENGIFSISGSEVILSQSVIGFLILPALGFLILPALILIGFLILPALILPVFSLPINGGNLLTDDLICLHALKIYCRVWL